MPSKRQVRPVVLSWDDDRYCVYVAGHAPKSQFLAAAITELRSYAGITLDDLPALSTVEYAYFRRASPSEARSRGWDYGFFKVNRDQYPKAFPVTLVEI